YSKHHQTSANLVPYTTLFRSRAWAEEKHRVTFVLIPASPMCRQALRPAKVSGILTTTLSARSASTRPSAIMPSKSVAATSAETRSEEHTSELQSRENLVCRLL